MSQRRSSIRKTDQSTRIDLRLPNDLLETLRQLAEDKFNAPIHHISKKPELTPTIIELIKLGIKVLEDNIETIGIAADSYTDKKTRDIEELKRKFEELEKKVNGLIEQSQSIGHQASLHQKDSLPAIAPQSVENTEANSDTVTALTIEVNHAPSAPSTIQNGLTNAQLTKFWGFKSPSAVGNAVARGLDYFREWSSKHDSEGKPWEFIGENKDRRFYRT